MSSPPSSIPVAAGHSSGALTVSFGMLVFGSGIMLLVMCSLFSCAVGYTCRRNAADRDGARRSPGDHPSVAPVFVYSSDARKEKLDCAVCLMEFVDGEEGRHLPKCGHEFHVGCIDMWLDSYATCPYCRAPVAGDAEVFDPSAHV